MKTSLEDWIKERINEHEKNHDYAIATDSLRAYIDVYNDFEGSETDLQPDSNPMKQQIEALIKEAEERIANYKKLSKEEEDNDFNVAVIYIIKMAESEHWLSRLKEMVK